MDGHLTTLFVANLLFIALKAFQQINVTERKFKYVPVTSFAMAQAEVWIMGSVAAVFLTAPSVYDKLLAGLTLGIAGSMGAIMSMRLQDILNEKANQKRKAQQQEV